MFEIPEKFVKKLEKLDDYYILRQDKESIIIGTKIIIKEHKEILGNVFQPFSKNVDRELPVFFLITFVKNDSKLIKEFIKRNYPILTYTNCNIKDLKQSLDEFISSRF